MKDIQSIGGFWRAQVSCGGFIQETDFAKANPVIEF
jgi:hypothetical protein